MRVLYSLIHRLYANEDIVLDFEITGSADANDYFIESNTVVIPAGGNSINTIKYAIVDEQQEGLEKILCLIFLL